MSGLRAFRPYTYTLAPGATIDLAASGRTVAVLRADAPFELSMQDGASFTMERGLSFVADGEFTKLVITNTAAGSNTITLVVGHGEFIDRRVSGAVDASLLSPASITTAADQAITANTSAQVAAVNLNRTEIIIQNNGTGDIRVGDANVSSTRGIKVAGGGSTVLQTTAAIRVYAVGAAATVGVTELGA